MSYVRSDIQKQFNEVICHSQGMDSVNTDSLFDKWESAKAPFIEKMGGLIYTAPEKVSFELDQANKNRRFVTFIETLNDIDYHLTNFLSMQSEGFFDNKTTESYNCDGISVPVGMKLGRALNLFSEYVSQCDIDRIQVKMSMIIQENKITGQLCLSVHPLDYISMSETQHGWRSCHALDGDYRTGNLSYMVDPCTVIAYIKSDEDVILPRFPSSVPWNNKKWRSLFFFDFTNSLLWAGRQYPFSSESALGCVTRELFEPLNFFSESLRLSRSIFNTSWSHAVGNEFKLGNEDCHLDYDAVYIRGELFPIKTFIEDASGSMQYNDLLYSSYYKPYFLRFVPIMMDITPKLNISKPMMVGGEAPCVCCGKRPIAHSEVMLCNECLMEETSIMTEDMSICDGCGTRMFSEDTYYFDDHCFCRTCYNELHIEPCSVCDTEIATALNDGYRTNEDGTYVCARCAHADEPSYTTYSSTGGSLNTIEYIIRYPD